MLASLFLFGREREEPKHLFRSSSLCSEPGLEQTLGLSLARSVHDLLVSPGVAPIGSPAALPGPTDSASRGENRRFVAVLDLPRSAPTVAQQKLILDVLSSLASELVFCFHSVKKQLLKPKDCSIDCLSGAEC